MASQRSPTTGTLSDFLYRVAQDDDLWSQWGARQKDAAIATYQQTYGTLPDEVLQILIAQRLLVINGHRRFTPLLQRPQFLLFKQV